MSKLISSLSLVAASLVVFGCDPIRDRVVGPGEVLVVDDGALFVGAPGTVANDPLPGVRVEGGSLVVTSGTVRGGNRNVVAAELPPPDGEVLLQRLRSGPGILVRNGSVELSAGARVLGGNVLVDDPTRPSNAAPLGGLGILGTDATIAIGEGAEVAGGLRINAGVPPVTAVPTLGVSIARSRLVISGGSVSSVVANSRSEVVISGGTIPMVGQAFGTLRMSGGTVGFALIDRGCAEIRGGTIEEIEALFPDNIFIFGTDFNLPLGLVDARTRTPVVRIEGVLENGDPLSLSIVDVSPQPRVILAPPGAPGCPPNS